MTAPIFFLLGFLSFWLYYRIRYAKFETVAQKILDDANEKSEKIQQEADLLKTQSYTKEKTLLEKQKLLQKEITNEKKELSLLQKQSGKAKEELSRFQAMSKEDAIIRFKEEVALDTSRWLQEKIESAKEEADQKASLIISQAMQRVAVDSTRKCTSVEIKIPHREMKNHLIGKEGKNALAFEKITKTSFTIDHKNDKAIISSFDPIEQHTAKETLKLLMNQQKIFPEEIEQCFHLAQEKITDEIQEAGEEAVRKCGIANLHPELITLLGKLRFRYSFGQNVLDHSIEVSLLMGFIAEELLWDANLAKRIGLLHDVGKTLHQKSEGSHALLGMEAALRYGESKEVANGVGCHHREVKPLSREAQLLSVADTISASRPGVRGVKVDRKRELESIACSFAGVEKAFAVGSGNEVRVIISSEVKNGHQLAKEISDAINSQATPSYSVRVSVGKDKEYLS